MKTYLAGEDEALDRFEFLTMAEAAELGRWEIVKVMTDRLGDTAASELADWAVTIQRGHVEGVREGCHKLAAAEAA